MSLEDYAEEELLQEIKDRKKFYTEIDDVCKMYNKRVDYSCVSYKESLCKDALLDIQKVVSELAAWRYQGKGIKIWPKEADSFIQRIAQLYLSALALERPKKEDWMSFVKKVKKRKAK